jgi:DNA-binding transcriptional regulator YiaG
MRQALRDILDAAPTSEARTSKEVVRWLGETLSIPQARLAAMLGVSHRTLQRWLAPADQTAPEGDDEARVRAVR